MVTAHFMIYFFGLPHHVNLGWFTLPMFPLVMAVELIIALILTLSGGQVTILLTEFYQGMITMVTFAILMVYAMMMFSWTDIVAGLHTAPEGQSMLNPLKASHVTDFNIWYFLIGIFGAIYNARSWQGASAYNSCPRTPHEAKMAGVLAGWRGFTQGILFLIIPIVAFAILNLGKFSDLAEPIRHNIQAIDDAQLKTQMTVPLVLKAILPIGMMGLFAGVIIASAVHTDETYLHSWGTIFVQDILSPSLKKPLSPKMHLLVLRLAIVGVALFGFIFSLVFPLKDFILMYFNLTGAIYLGGAGSVIIGGLYWKRGTTLAAWVAMILGSVLAFGGMSLQQLWPNYLIPILIKWYPHSVYLKEHADKFPINGTIMYFYAMLASITVYILISLFGPKKIFDMDKMLHRGKYAVAEDNVKESAAKKKTFKEILGLTPEFTRGDRFLFWATFWWNMGWWFLFLFGTIAGILFIIPDSVWSGFWWFKIWLSGAMGLGLTVWFIWGGLKDMKQLFHDLKTTRRDDQDDGTVTTKEAAHYIPAEQNK
jgi:SSS family solute:Na+ symporter